MQERQYHPFRPIPWAKQTIEGRLLEVSGSKITNFYPVVPPNPSEAKTPVILYGSPGTRRWAEYHSRIPYVVPGCDELVLVSNKYFPFQRGSRLTLVRSEVGGENRYVVGNSAIIPTGNLYPFLCISTNPDRIINDWFEPSDPFWQNTIVPSYLVLHAADGTRKWESGGIGGGGGGGGGGGLPHVRGRGSGSAGNQINTATPVWFTSNFQGGGIRDYSFLTDAEIGEFPIEEAPPIGVPVVRGDYFTLEIERPSVHALLPLKSVIYGDWLFGLADGDKFIAAPFGSDGIPGDYDPFAASEPSALHTIPAAQVISPGDAGVAAIESDHRIPLDLPDKLSTDGRLVLFTTKDEVYIFDLGREDANGVPEPGFITFDAPIPEDPSNSQDLVNAEWVDHTWSDGYFILAAKSGQFFHSNLYSSQFDQLDFARAEYQSDGAVGIEAFKGRIYIFGEQTIETWFNSGGRDFAFSPDRSYRINVGCISKHTIQQNEEFLCFLGNNLIVYQIAGSQPSRISDETVEKAIADSHAERAYAFVYTEEGHMFYSLTLAMKEGGRRNWTFDFATNVWHERTITDILCAERFGAQTLVGKRGENKIFDQRLDWGDDDGTALEREAISPRLFMDYQRVSIASFQIDIPRQVPSDSQDQVLLDWADDLNPDQQRNWKTPVPFDLRGGPRFRANRCGVTTEGRWFRIRTSSRNRVEVHGAYVRIGIRDG